MEFPALGPPQYIFIQGATTKVMFRIRIVLVFIYIQLLLYFPL